MSVLAIAFFWGGNTPKGPGGQGESGEAQSVHESSPSPAAVKPSGQENGGQADDAGPIGDKAAGTDNKEASAAQETKAAGEAQSEKPADKEKSADSEQKKPEEPVAKEGDKDSAAKEQDKKTKPAPTIKTEPKPAVTAEPKKDKYMTDPVPEGKPKPVEWQDTKVNKNKSLTVTLSVSAKTILNNMDLFNKDKLEVLPKDGVIYKTKKVTFYEGESVFDVLLREMKASKIHMEFEMTPIYNSNYIEGIHNLYEFDCGELSGWMYKVNGWFPNYGSSRYMLKDGDVVEWLYTCDLGRDIGGGMAATGEKK
ncbi:DUF4430 domain-containing protein [Paenibacillus sp. N10]|uniref:DUF4430 domain-containing protein n=2 Tax=Paenibacillus lutrae TaxID=2078573 RepID=A0A7X3JY45_9BACL|nr:DUF4430 domain-containing protein [Paenibacillus lutrae]MVO98656.1 DUF4430 domain-containing protein [Paenibacillus lutrae]